MMNLKGREFLRRLRSNWRRLLWITTVLTLLALPIMFGARAIYARPTLQLTPAAGQIPTATPSPTATSTATPAATMDKPALPLVPAPKLRSPFVGSGGDPSEHLSVKRATGHTQAESPLATPASLTVPEEVSASISQSAPSTKTITDSQTSAVSGENLSATESVSDTATVSNTSSVTATEELTALLYLPIADGTGSVSTAQDTKAKDGSSRSDMNAADTGVGGEIVQAEGESAPPVDVLALLVPTPTPAPNHTANQQPSLPAPDGTDRIVRVPILMYHYLSEPPADADIYRRDLSVSPTLFAEHLNAMLDAGYTTITLYELVDYLTQGVPLPPKPVIITFDDGYVDNYRNALPLLRERGMVATFFVVTDFMDEERREYLNWDMAREMQDAGMKIESHGRNHVSLKDKDEDYLVWQALGSLETIQYELGIRPRFVSYPAGEYDRNTIELFKSAGYWAGVVTKQGSTHSSDSLFELQRIRVRGTTTREELLYLLALDW